jgi:hypothetical protein
MTYPGYDQLNVYYGDLHSHCHQVGYGYGSVDEAYQNACSQLDFASVTAHAHWSDIPRDEARLAGTVTYHLDGFKRAAEAWPVLIDVTEAVYKPGRFVSFPSFEWHSRQYGDHNIYFKGATGDIIRAADLEDLRINLRRLKEQGTDCLMIPHHIGYAQGYRGISWADFTPEFSPLVEMFSMHGQAESDDAPYPYMHTMGPRDERSTMQYGLRTGQIFGVVGSTDHHSAFPGSYGYGRAAVWASDLTREGIWEAIVARRTYALTGDRIGLAFAVNHQPMGSILPNSIEREIVVAVVGGGALEFVELLHNNRPIQRWSAHEQSSNQVAEPLKVLIELGWGQKDELTDWQVDLEVTGGQLLSVEPRFRGPDIVAPQKEAPTQVTFSAWEQVGESQVQFSAQTWGNPTILTPATQGMCLEIWGDEQTRLQGHINHCQIDLPLEELKTGARTGHLGGFLSPAYSFHRAVRKSEYSWQNKFQHQHQSRARDWYYVRVCQKNGQWAWSSPIWIDGQA